MLPPDAWERYYNLKILPFWMTGDQSSSRNLPFRFMDFWVGGSKSWDRWFNLKLGKHLWNIMMWIHGNRDIYDRYIKLTNQYIIL